MDRLERGMAHATPHATEAPRLATHGLTKSFGPVRACEDVSIALGRGEIVALLGENGAGKSTLVKMLFGALQPDEGRIEWEGRAVTIPEPAAARALGIGMVHQHFSLFEAFTVAQNVALALPDMKLKDVAERARATSAAYGLPLDPSALVADLSVGERQRIEVVRCLMQDPSLVVMDEPTSVLTPQEADRLFAVLRALRDEGRTVLYISHKLEEVRQLCDRAVVMRAGRVVAEVVPAEETAGSLAAAMVGGEVPTVRAERRHLVGGPVLELRGLTLPAETPHGTALSDAWLRVRRGEVIGLAGMAGNGQGELFAAISGERRTGPAEVLVCGEEAGALGVDARRALGAAFVPEERIGHAAAPGLDLTENVLLTRHARGDGTRGAGGWLRRGRAGALAARVIGAMDVRTRGPRAPAGSLSGGNLQKFLMGRELDRAPRLLVVDQPTWGVDAAAAANIRQALVDLAAGGAGVLVVSQDLDELFEIADRIAVISAGTIGPLEPVEGLTREAVGLAMGGATRSQRRRPLAA